MADIQANIGVNIETGAALAQLKQLQRQISQFHTQMAKGGAATQAATANMQQNLVNSINATGKFNAQLTNIKTTTESFTNSLEKNKFSLGQYFRYGAASTKTFSRFFRGEFETINKVARERVKDLQTQYVKMGRDANGAMKAIAVRPLALDMENVATRTAIAAQKQQLFNQLLRQGSTNLLNFGKNTQWAGRQLMVGFTIPLGILGMTASRVFMEMEKQAIAFRKVYGDLFTPEKERDRALKDIENLGEEFTKYGIAVADTIGLAADAAAAGFSGADLQSQTAQATKLAVLGQIETQQALETTIALQNAFKMSNEELAESINFLNAVENQTVVSLDDITTAIPKVAPVIKALGGDVQDLSFFLAAMKEGGVNAAEGANALKSGLARIINPTQKATEFMASLGINIKGIVEQNAGDLMGTMMNLGQALDQLDPLNRSRAIEQLFGRFQFARISTLFDNITKQGTQASRVADLATASIEELAALSEGELAVVSDSTTAKFQSAFEKLKAELAPVGEEFLKLATPFVEFGTKVLDSFNNMGDGTKRVIMGLIAILGGIGPIALMTFGLLANGVANLIKMFAVLSGAFSRSKQDTQTLGQQFDYLTQEQIQASSVAASLDQVHNQLKQTFTSEARAVDRLRAAYEKAIVSQRNFRGPVVSGGKTVKPKGYAAGGIIKGPGTGTSDSIAAMVSNGEAIIPAAMTKKYGALINGIIADEIPGFKTGLIPTYPEYAMRLQNKSENMAQRASGGTGFENVLSPLALRIGEARGITPGKASVGAGKFDSIADEYEAISKKFTQKLNKEFDTTFKGIEDSNERYQKAWQAAGKAVEKDVNKIKSDVDRGVVRKTFGLDEDYYGSAPTEARRAGSKELTRARRSIRSGGPRSYTSLGPSAQALFSRRTGQSAADLQMGHVSQPKLQNIEKLVSNPKASNAIKRAAQRMGFMIADSTVAGVNQAAQSKSPSKKAKRAGANIAQGAVLGIESGTDDAQRAGARVGTAVATGATGGGGRFRDPQTGRFAKAPQAPVGIPAAGKAAAGFGKFNRGLMSSSFALTGLSSIAMMAGGETGKFAEGIAKVSGVLFGLSAVTELVSSGMDSNMGKKILPKIGNFLKKFKFGLVGAVGVLALLVGGGMALYAAHQKQKQAIEGLGNVATMTSDKMQKLGDIFGVTLSEGGLSRGFAPSLEGVDAETQAQGQQLVGTKEFQTTFKKDIEAIKNGAAKDVELALKTLGARLEASGFAQEQVQSIVNALVQEAGRTDLSLDFASLGIGTEGARAALKESLAEAREGISSLPEITGSTVSVSGTEVSGVGPTDYATEKYGATSASALPSPERLQSIDQYASALTGTFEALGQGVENGLISVAEFNSDMDSVLANFDKLEEGDKAAVFEKMLESLPEGSDEFKTLLGTVDDFDSKMSLLRAKSTGMLDDDVIAEYADRLKDAGKSGKSTAPIIAELNKELGTQVELTEQQAAAEIAAAEVTAAQASLEERLADAQEQNEVYERLIGLGVPVAQAQAMIADSTLRSGLAAATTKEDFQALIEQYNLVLEEESKIPKAVSGGSGKASSSIDKITESLRKLVSGTTQVTEGFNASSRSIESALSAGTDGFNGLSQQLRRVGASQDLIDLVVGMPPEEFEKYKGRLFNFDPATNSITGLKAEAKKLGGALRAIAIGEYLEEQRAFIVNTQNQISAVTKLRASGLSYAEALKIVENQSIATAIATAATTAELNEILRITQEVSSLQAQMDRERERSQVSDSVRAANKEYGNQAAVLNKLAQSQGQYTDSQIRAILDDPDLSTLFLNPSIDPGALSQALKNAQNRANLELNVKIATEEGRETLFDEYISEVNDYFAQEENKVEIDFRLATDADQGIVREAENQIAKLQYQVDDYQAELKGIEDQEQTINDKYADRFKALDEVAKANERVNRAQQAQLSIADALSRGDIAAAARAQQELKTQQAQAAQETRRESLQRQQEAELAGVRSGSGLSREQLEQNVKDVQDEIFGIEEARLEPAQERIRLAEIDKDLQVEALEVSGRTKDQWEQISNLTTRAAEDTDAFATNIERALGLYEYFVNGVELSRDLFGEVEAKVVSMGASLPAAPAPAPASQAPRPAPIQIIEDDVPGVTRAMTVPEMAKAAAATSDAYTKSMLMKSINMRNNTTGVPIGQTLRGIGGMASGGLASRSRSGPPVQMAMGGKVKGYPMGGLIPYKSEGGFFKSLGSDTIPAMLTPGEYVVRRPAVKEFGVKNLEDINRGTYGGGSVYNYNLAVNVKSDADPNRIANTVMRSIKQVEGQKIRGNRI